SLAAKGRTVDLSNADATPQTHDTEAALATVAEIQDPGERWLALKFVIAPALAAGDFDALRGPMRAMAAALQKGGGAQPMELHEFALLLLAMGDLERPLVAAREMTRRGAPPLLLAYIAWAQAKTGDKAAAEATLQEILAALPSQSDAALIRRVNYLVALARA